MKKLITQDVQKEVVERFLSDVGKMSIMVFTALDFKTHIEGMVIDDDTKEQYIITINKISNGKLFKDGGVVFTKEQRYEYLKEQTETLRQELKEKVLTFLPSHPHLHQTNSIDKESIDNIIDEHLNNLSKIK
jgi:hypothetical protein